MRKSSVFARERTHALDKIPDNAGDLYEYDLMQPVFNAVCEPSHELDLRCARCDRMEEELREARRELVHIQQFADYWYALRMNTRNKIEAMEKRIAELTEMTNQR